jgi:hypothetical protein
MTVSKRKRAPARSKTTKKPIAQKARALRGASHEDLRFVLQDVRREFHGVIIGQKKRTCKAAGMEMNRRYRGNRKTEGSFHPSEFAYSELEAIAKGRGGEAWTFVMRRNDVPLTARVIARQEMARRDAERVERGRK